MPYEYIIQKIGSTTYAKYGLDQNILSQNTDASIVIQAAIDALGTFSGKSIFIKSGTYTVDATLTVTTPGGYFGLVGEHGKTYLKPSGNFPALDINNKSFMEIRNLGFLHSQVGYTSSMLKFSGATAHNKIINCTFDDNSGARVGNAIGLDSTSGAVYNNRFIDCFVSFFENAIFINQPNTTYFVNSNNFNTCSINQSKRILKHNTVSGAAADANNFTNVYFQAHLTDTLCGFDYETNHAGRSLYTMHENVMVWDLPGSTKYALGNGITDLSLVNCYPAWLIGGTLATNGRVSIFDRSTPGNVTAITNTDSPYSITSIASNGVLRANATSGAITINLPSAANTAGKVYSILRTDMASSTNIITIDANGTETIDGNLTYLLYPGEWIRIMSDGTNWVVLDRPQPTVQGYYFLKGSTANRRYLGGVANTQAGANLLSTTSPAANTLWALPFIIARTTQFDRSSIVVGTGSTSGNSRTGIYRDNGNCYPGVLIWDSGAIDTTTTGQKDVTITPTLILQPGLYWSVYEQDTATGQYRLIPNVTTVINLHGTDLGASVQTYFYSVAHTFGALPNPYTAGGTLLNTNSAVGTPVVAVGWRPV